MAKQLDAIALVVFWTAVGGLMSGRQGKRLFARISAGGTLGAIFGSFTSGWLGHAFGIATLLPIATLTMVVAALATVPLLRIAPPRFHRTAPPAPIQTTASRRLGPLWRAGALFRVLVLASLLAGILGPILYFEFAYVADLATQGSGGEQRLLNLYALFRGWLNVGVLVIQIIGTPAVFRRLGVPLASALSPDHLPARTRRLEHPTESRRGHRRRRRRQPPGSRRLRSRRSASWSRSSPSACGPRSRP